MLVDWTAAALVWLNNDLIKYPPNALQWHEDLVRDFAKEHQDSIPSDVLSHGTALIW